MSIKLPTIDITGFGVGSTTSFNLKNVGLIAVPSIRGDNKPILQIFNDSGVGFAAVTHTEQHGFNLPAGAWRNVALIAGEISVDFVAEYVLPNPPVSKLMATYYAPGEVPDPIGTLGNSPIGGGVQTSSVQTLSNEGGGAGIEVIDIGTSTTAKLLDIFNDHFVWSVQQTLVAHQVLKGQTSGNPLQIGQAGDVTEILGQLSVDQALTALAAIFPNIAGTTVAGGVAGTATFWEPLQGSALKIAIVFQSGYRTGGSAQDFVFPTGFTNGCIFIVSDSDTFIFKSGATTRSPVILTALAVGGGTATSTTNVASNSIGFLGQSFDTIEINALAGSNHTGFILCIGN
jgi:hypothetical protein